jgi:uncharacterized protein
MIKTIKNDMVQAMKDKEKTKLLTLRMLLALIETERGKVGLKDVSEFTEDQIVSLINRNVKTLNQEIDSLVKAGRDISNQEEQKEILMSYLPKQMSLDEVKDVVAEVGRLTKESGEKMGFAMKELSTRLKGKADMSVVSALIKEELNK